MKKENLIGIEIDLPTDVIIKLKKDAKAVGKDFNTYMVEILELFLEEEDEIIKEIK